MPMMLTKWNFIFVSIVVALIAIGYSATTTSSSSSSTTSKLFMLLTPLLLDTVQVFGSKLTGSITPKGDTTTSLYEYGDDGLPLCDGCHCTPEWDYDVNSIQNEEDKFVCPSGTLPPWNYSLETIQALEKQEIQNPFTLECDPYNDHDCDTIPKLEQRYDDAVCGIIYDYNYDDLTLNNSINNNNNNNNTTNCPLTTYKIQTFKSTQEANENNAIITHTGPCGLCSTTQDLAAYMKHPDMVAEGRRCTNKAAFGGLSWGISCYESLGFTTPCATIWSYNSNNTFFKCTKICIKHMFSPANEPFKPHCRLNECLHCDEIISGPNFQKFAGRTRRNSGLRTPILRQCKGLATMTHDGCPINTIINNNNSKRQKEGKGGEN